jgi:hypothetical protein
MKAPERANNFQSNFPLHNKPIHQSRIRLLHASDSSAVLEAEQKDVSENKITTKKKKVCWQHLAIDAKKSGVKGKICINTSKKYPDSREVEKMFHNRRVE